MKSIGSLLAVLVVFVILIVGILFAYQNGLLAFLGLGAERTTVTATVILERVQSMSALTTTRYNFSSLVTSEREMPGLLAGLYGERMQMVAVGHIDAGIDLSQLGEDDVALVNDRLTLRLPPPVLQDCILNEQDSYVVSQDTGLFASPSPDLDTQARRYALEQFRVQALERGILDEANEEAIYTLQQFILLLAADNVAEVEIVAQEGDPNAPLPETCA